MSRPPDRHLRDHPAGSFGETEAQSGCGMPRPHGRRAQSQIPGQAGICPSERAGRELSSGRILSHGGGRVCGCSGLPAGGSEGAVARPPGGRNAILTLQSQGVPSEVFYTSVLAKAALSPVGRATLGLTPRPVSSSSQGRAECQTGCLGLDSVRAPHLASRYVTSTLQMRKLRPEACPVSGPQSASEGGVLFP